MSDRRTQIIEELTRLTAESARVTVDMGAAETLDEQTVILETRSRPIVAQMQAAFAELRQLDLNDVREKIKRSLAASGRGSRIMKSAGRDAAEALDTAHAEAAELLETADGEAAELLETAEQEAAELREDAQRNADDLIEDAITAATEILDEAEEEVDDLRN